ncbi:hypothetical protein SJI19_21930 [Acerihabitans sp. TG2]|uniref:hypothetical protein n=1 Tax=Acerihabitans sp. TG2 TaxID=3096008 RepID=UPI002B22FA89|nr:hypothetical protein [Acerihabitans sp. TG2]MEA9393164.1 hypothetical protein [Acerihabitans sp. TG2]
MKNSTRNLLKIVIKQQTLNFIGIFICVFIAYFCYLRINFNLLKEVLATLQSLSTAIFTIVGIWIGYLYPNAISSIANEDVSYIKNEKDAPRIEKLVYILITSALVMLSTLLIYLFKAILPTFDFYMAYKALFKFICVSFLFFMCWTQAKCILSIIISNLHFVNNLHGRLNKAKLNQDD